MKKTFRQRMLSILLSACIALGVFVPLQGTQKAAAADDDMYKYEYENDEGKNVTVWISKEGVTRYTSSPFGWDTRGGYVMAKIDLVGNGNDDDKIQVWLSQGGPCGDGIARDSWDEYVAAGVKEHMSAPVGQNRTRAYGNYEQSMFWFSANDFKMDSDDSVAGTMISEYLQGYMSKYFNSLYTANFEPGIKCEVVWGNAVQVPKGTILDDLEKYEVIPGKPESTTVRPKFIDYALSLNKAGTDMLRASEWTVHEDGTGLTRNGGCDDIGSRVSSTYSGHVKTVPKEELICYSAADMDNATKRICGADGKEAASSGWGYKGQGLASNTPCGLATPKTQKYIDEHWNAKVKVQISDSVMSTMVKLAFYDIASKAQVGNASSHSIPNGPVEYNSSVKVENWASDIPASYALAKDTDRFPAFHVGQENDKLNFEEYHSVKGKIKARGTYAPDSATYSIASLPAADYTIVWIPVEKKKNLYVQFYDVNAGKELGGKKICSGQFAVGEAPGVINAANLLMSNYGPEWSVAWESGTAGTAGFFAVYGNKDVLYRELEIARANVTAKYAGTDIEVKEPNVKLDFAMADEEYSVLWVPVSGQQQRVEVVYIDADDGTVISDVTENDVDRGQKYVPAIPTGYRVSEEGNYRSKGAALKSEKTFITEDYDSLLNKPNQKLDYDMTDYSFVVPTGSEKRVSCKLFIPLIEDSPADLYVHYYDADTGKQIEDSGFFVKKISCGSKIGEFCITDAAGIPYGYEYREGEPLTVYGTKKKNVADSYSSAKSQKTLKGSIDATGVSVLYGKTSDKVPKSAKYVCMWIPLSKESAMTAKVTVELINAVTGDVIPDAKYSGTALRGEYFPSLDHIEDSIPDGYVVDNTRAYRAKAAYSRTAMPLDCTYSQMDSCTGLDFSDYSRFSVRVPNESGGKLGVKVFIPAAYADAENVKKVNLIYYDITTGSTIENGPTVSIPGDRNSYTPSGVKSIITSGGKTYSRAEGSTYMYYAVKEGGISGIPYSSAVSKGLARGTVTDSTSASISVPAAAREMNIYIGMSAGECTVSLYYVDAGTGETIGREYRAARYSSGQMTLDFNSRKEIVFGEKRYSPVSYAKDSLCAYPSAAYYCTEREDSGIADVSYPYCKGDSRFVNINGGGRSSARTGEGTLSFGPVPSGKNGNVINLYVPCTAAKKVVVHCVAEDKKDSTDFLATFEIWTGAGEKVEQRLGTYVIGGVTYRPDLNEAPCAVILSDSSATLSYNAANTPSRTAIDSSVRKDGTDAYIAETKEANKLDKHTVMYVVYSPDDPEVTVKYVTLKNGDVDTVLKTEDGGKARYNEKYSYAGGTSVTYGGNTYNVTGEGEVLAYGSNSYMTAIGDSSNKKGVPATYDGAGRWTTDKKYKSHDDGVLYIPVELDGYPVTVKYITLKADGSADKVITTLDGGEAAAGMKYTYEGAMSVIGTDGRKYTVLGEKEAFAYDSTKYAAALADTTNTKGVGVSYTPGTDEGTWVTKKKVKAASKATLYIPVRTGIPVTIIYVDSNDGTHIKETPGKPAEPGKKYTTPYEPAIPIDEKTVYVPDPSNPPTLTWKEEPYPGPVTPVNDPDEPSVTTPKVPSGTPTVIIYIPVIKEVPPEPEDPADVTIDKVPKAEAKIRSKLFDVEKAIPSTEYEYAEIKADGYTLKVKMHSETGTKDYSVSGTQTISYTWDEHDDPDDPDRITGQGKSTTTTTETATVTRSYSYWVIDEIGYYTLDNVKIDNGSIDDSLKYTVTSKDIVFPELTYSHSTDIKKHIKEPQGSRTSYVSVPTIYYHNGVYESGPSCYSYVASEASRIGEIKCINDSLIFDGVRVLDDKATAAKAPDPNLRPVEKAAPVLKLETTEVQIPAARKNIKYDDSKGFATYVPRVVFNSPAAQQRVEIPNINHVKVHTPVVNRTGVIEDNLKYVQDVNADKTKYHVVVGRAESYGSSGNENITSDFTIDVRLDGQHIAEKGYGNRDYSKYVYGYGSTVNGTDYPAGVQVCFPFEAVADVGNDGKENNDIVLEANTWNSIYARYYVPEWVKEDTYTCQVRVLACNAKGDYEAVQKNANLSDVKYAALDTFEVEVSGKIYGLTLTSNNSAAPDWKDVFTAGGKIKNAYAEKYPDGTFSPAFSKDYRYYYMAGLRNEIGLDMWAAANGKTLFKDPKYVYPLLAGSSPALKGSGMLKSGYTWNFKLETAGGRMANEAATLAIRPTFYWVSKDGRQREEVDMWYAGKVDGKTYNFIRAGSAVDGRNTFVDYAASATMGIPAGQIEFVDAIRRQKNRDDETTVTNTAVFTYGGISLQKNFKTYTNDAYAKLFASKQSLYSEAQLRQLKQTWYFKYGLPDVYHLCAKGYDVEAYVKKNGGCTYKEDFWKKDGYLVVNFAIEAYDKNGSLALMYSNTEQNVRDGMCDMWKMEGYQNDRTDSNGNRFRFEDGDVIIVALPGTTGKNPPTNLSEDKEVNRLN